MYVYSARELSIIGKGGGTFFHKLLATIISGGFVSSMPEQLLSPLLYRIPGSSPNSGVDISNEFGPIFPQGIINKLRGYAETSLSEENLLNSCETSCTNGTNGKTGTIWDTPQHQKKAKVEEDLEMKVE